MRITTYETGGNSLNPCIKLFVFLIVLGLFVIPVSALDDYSTSGVVSYQDSISLSYYEGAVNYNSPSPAKPILNTELYHRFTDAKELYFVRITSGSYTYTSSPYSDVTSFTASVDDIYYGSGIASVINNAGSPIFEIRFNFINSTYANSLTSIQTIVIAYDNNNLFDGLTASNQFVSSYIYTTHNNLPANELSSVTPTMFKNQHTNYVHPSSYHVGYSTYYKNDYIYNYDSTSNFFTLNVDKLGFSSLVSTVNTTGNIYVQDSGYTAINYNIYDEYASGVILAIKFDIYNGMYVNTTIQTGDAISSAASPKFDDVSWDYPEYFTGETAHDYYTIGDTGVYEWYVDLNIWSDILYKYQVQIMHNGIVVETNGVDDTGVGYYNFDSSGAYVAEVQSSLFWPTNWITRGTATTTVSDVESSYINVPSTSAIKTNFTATYLYGSTPISPIINIKVLQNDYTYKIIDTKILPAAIAGTTYTTNLSISSLSPIGYYVVELYDNGQGKSFATDTIQTTYAYIPPVDVVLNSYVNTTDNIYSLGGIISGSYAIDDTNYTNYYTKLQVYNIDKDIISFSFIPLHQVDNFDIPITNSELNFYSDGVNRYPISINFLAGQNAVRLASYNTDGSLNEVIIQKNITLSITNDEGYGLTLSKYMVDETEIFAIKAITPTQASIVIHPLTLMGISDTTILINGSTQISYAIGIADTYTISLVSGGETKITQIIKVFEDEEIIATIDEDAIISDTTFQDNTTSLLNSPYLIGLFIMCVFLAIGATNGIGGTIVTGSLGLGIVCYMGIFPWILLVIEVLVVAVLMGKGIINLSGD